MKLIAESIKAIEKEGVALAHKVEWDGIAILQICYAALTDSNYHPEAAVIDGLIKMNNRFENDGR